MTKTTITGRAAIEYARERGLALSKYSDPTEGAREGLTVDEAELIAAEDPGLIHITPRKFRISNRVSGHDFGIYEASSREEALEVMVRDAGYDSAEEMGKVGDGAPNPWDEERKLNDDLEIVEIPLA